MDKNFKIIEYKTFTDELEKTVFKNAKADLIEKVAKNPDRYVGIFRPTTPRIKLMQNITQSHEIGFGDFLEDIFTIYLGKFYENLPKNHTYKNEKISFDQLFKYNDKIYMIEQKVRDDHDSTKKRGQYENFSKKVDYLLEKYPNTKIVAIMWMVDPSLTKNKNYYTQQMNLNKNPLVEMHLFYGEELLEYLGEVSIWDEMTEYLLEWKSSEDNLIELNFENDWENTKSELKSVPKSIWKKLISDKRVVNEVLPILFPTGKYKEILDELNIDYE